MGQTYAGTVGMGTNVCGDGLGWVQMLLGMVEMGQVFVGTVWGWGQMFAGTVRDRDKCLCGLFGMEKNVLWDGLRYGEMFVGTVGDGNKCLFPCSLCQMTSFEQCNTVSNHCTVQQQG